MRIIQFGGPLGAITTSSIVAHPRCQGEASLPDDAGAEVVQAAPMCLMKHATQAVAQWVGAKGIGAPMRPEDVAAIAAAAAAELGVSVQIGSFHVAYSDEDRAQIAEIARQRRQALIEREQASEAAAAAPPPPPPPAQPGAPYGTALAGAPPRKRSGGLFAIVGGAVVVLAVAFGLVWHFAHEHGTAPPNAHEHSHSKR